MYSFGSDLCNLLRPHTDPEANILHNRFEAAYWQPVLADFYSDHLTADILADTFWKTAQCRAQRFRDAHAIYEWIATPADLEPHSSPENNWTDHTPLPNDVFPTARTAVSPHPPLNYQAMADDLKSKLRLDPTDVNHAHFFALMDDHESPALIAIDAGTYTAAGATMVCTRQES